jgi:RNA-binding protein
MLTPSFKRNLATKAHQIRPVVLIGINGLTPQVHHEIDAALNAHELLKIRINASSREIREEMIGAISTTHHASLVQKIGHIVVIYRANPEKKKKK